MNHHTHIVGIVNITPDSFSDGGSYDALARIDQCVREGADVVDIGAESTRPGAMPLTHEQEWARLKEPFSKALEKYRAQVAFSIDTRHPQTARKALGLGVEWVNDVSGFADAAMVDVVRDSECRLVVMHSLTVPADPAVTLPEHVDVVEQLIGFARERLESLEASGINRERIIFDPGIGFGKTAKQSMQIITQVGRFREFGVPILIGHSRKSFLSLMTDAPAAARDGATLEISRQLTRAGVDYLRVHDVKSHVEMLGLCG